MSGTTETKEQPQDLHDLVAASYAELDDSSEEVIDDGVQGETETEAEGETQEELATEQEEAEPITPPTSWSNCASSPMADAATSSWKA